MDQTRIKFQRDFYHLILSMSENRPTLSEVLQQALSLIADVSGAEQAYIEVTDDSGEQIYQSLHDSDVALADIQKGVSTGIIAETIKAGKPLLIPSALIDPRFEARESVQRLAIESVLCVPFFGKKTKGVLYLQGDSEFVNEAAHIQLDAELFSKHVSPLLDEMLFARELEASKNSAFDALREQHNLAGLVGESDALFTVTKSAMMIAPLEVTTLLLGETGTGKTSLAQAIHNNSRRTEGHFVEVSCAALPEALLENELFGAVAGGHSTATQTVEGKVSQANNGTLFLDEVGELSLGSQAKLLQFLQSGEYYPLGSAKIQTSDIRLICATNRDLHKMVREGLFREDLYYRINTFELELPNLAERDHDRILLVKNFIEACCSKHSFPLKTLDKRAEERILSADISGNLRGLSAAVERACIQAQLAGSDVVLPEHLQLINAVSPKTNRDFQEATASFQKTLLEDTLKLTNWNISKTAREMGLSRSHVHNLIKSFGLKRD